MRNDYISVSNNIIVMFPSYIRSPSLQAKEDAEKEHVKAMLALQVMTLTLLCLLLHIYICLSLFFSNRRNH